MSDYSLEQQKLLISALLSNKELFIRCESILKDEYFHQQLRKTIRFIAKFSEKYKSIPSCDQIFAETAIRYELIEMSQEHSQYFMDEIEAFCKHQALMGAIIKGSEMLDRGEYGAIEQVVKDALMVGLSKDLGLDYFANPRERLELLKDSNGRMSTGWLSVDQKIYNVNRKELLIFAAPSGGGKSVALQNLSLNMALQGYNCVYFTLELSESLCAMRLDSMVTGVKTTEIFKKLDEVELLVASTSKQAGKIVFKRMPSGATTLDLRSYLKEYQIQRGIVPDVILVDYIDLMGANNRKISAENLFVKDKYVCEELRDLGHDLNSLVATASQLGRSAADTNEFNHSHIAGGISKINTADNVIGIFNNPVARQRGVIEFQFMKTRNSGGVDQKIELAYDIETLRITDADTSQINHRTQSANIMDKIKRSGEKKTTVEKSDPTPIIANNQDPVQRAAHLSKLMDKIKK